MEKAIPRLYEIHLGHVLGAATLLIMPITVFAPLATTLFVIFTGLLVLAVFWRRAESILRPPTRTAWILLALMALGAVSAGWSPDAFGSVLLALRLTGMFAAGWLMVDAALRLGESERRVTRTALIVGFLLGAAFFAVDAAVGGPVTDWLRGIAGSTPIDRTGLLYNRPATIFAVLFWPVVAALLRARLPWVALALAPVTVVLTMESDSGSAVVAIGLGLAVFPVAWAWPRQTPRILAALLGAGVLTAPLLARAGLSIPAVADWSNVTNSYGHRLRIWRHATELIAQKPLLGWGFDASRHLSTGRYLDYGDLMPLHPHNAALQVWVELGAVGAVLAAALAVLFCLAMDRLIRDQAGRAASVAGTVTACAILSLSYGVWQYWWLATLWLATAFMLAVATGSPAGRAESSDRKAARRPGAAHGA